GHRAARVRARRPGVVRRARGGVRPVLRSSGGVVARRAAPAARARGDVRPLPGRPRDELSAHRALGVGAASGRERPWPLKTDRCSNGPYGSVSTRVLLATVAFVIVLVAVPA